MTGSNKSSERILLVEDDPTNQYVFRAILASGGFEVDIADNGRDGVDCALASRPALILLDMMMPIMDGYEAARILSSDPRLDGVPIIALTAKAMHGDRDRCLENGCDDYLAKPVGRKSLIQMIERWLSAAPEGWMDLRLRRRRRSA